MAITTLAGVNSGMQYPQFVTKSASSGGFSAGKPVSYWALGGNPKAGAFDATLNGVVLSGSSSQVTGQIPFTDPNSGAAYLGFMRFIAQAAGTVVLYDRLWHNGGYDVTVATAQLSTTPTWPARDIAGATSGDGVLLGLEIQSSVGAATPTVTIAYTNSAGTGSRSATNIAATTNTMPSNSFIPIGLQAGDTGVQSVQSLTLSTSWLSGTINLVAYREIARLEVLKSGIVNAVNAPEIGMPKMYAGTVPALLFIPRNLSLIDTGTSLLQGTINYTWG